jgi:ABC-type polysaccharide/polyol phosphate transport system ATPase subunit
MTQPALNVEQLGKAFRVAARRRGAGDDPRREPVSRRHDRFHALRGVGFSVAAGETLGVVGHNGSGKSTLLKILAGVMTPDSGGFTATGRIGALLELGAGFHPDLSGIENVYLNGALLGLSTTEITRLLPEIIEFAELERFMDLPVRHYSSGMQSRLGFAVATRLAPEILLMDETFATGDARFQSKALAHVAAMKARGHTLLLVSHDVELMLELADRVLWLEKGRVRRIGPPREVMADYRRSQQTALRAPELRRGSLGLDVLYEPIDSAAGLSIRGVQLATGRHPASDALLPCELPIELAGRLTLRLELTGPPALSGRRACLHVAWASADRGRVLAQSRTPLQLDFTAKSATDGAGLQRVELAFNPWRLTEGRWQAAVALELVDGGTAGQVEAGAAPLFGRVYAARQILPAIVRTTTPNAYEVPAIAMIGSEWQFD